MGEKKICPFMSYRMEKWQIDDKSEVECIEERCMAWVEEGKFKTAEWGSTLEEPIYCEHTRSAYCKLLTH